MKIYVLCTILIIIVKVFEALAIYAATICIIFWPLLDPKLLGLHFKTSENWSYPFLEVKKEAILSTLKSKKLRHLHPTPSDTRQADFSYLGSYRVHAG